jgi:cystathionine beta-lyase
MKFASRLVNFESAPGDPYRPIATPIYQTATFEQERVDAFGEYDYSRSGNPTRAVLERQLAILENGAHAYCFSSGMAAISAVARLLRAGDEILADVDLYGGTCRLFSKVLDRTGIRVRYADARDLESFARHLTPATKLVHLESPTNPLFRVIDLNRAAEVAHARGALLSVDNSAMSPYLQNPLDLGADIVIHSGTKFLGGHHDVTAGAVIVKDEKLAQQIRFIYNAEGAALAPFDSFLLLRGLKTLKLRIDCQQKNALAVAKWLTARKEIAKVYYPGLADCDGYELHQRQASGPGSVMSFTTGSVEFSRAIAESTKLFHITVSFGSVSSSIGMPGTMSHASVPAEVLSQRELPPDLVRISVGIEDEEDLVADLSQAIKTATLRDLHSAG